MIRLATSADAAGLSQLHSSAFAEGWSEDELATWLGRKECFAAIALRERDAVAFGLALAAGEDAELLTLAVAQDQRRLGLGAGIFAALDIEAGKRALARWVLEVARNNSPALALYKSAGFVEIGARKAYYRTAEGRIDAALMSRAVGGSGGHIGA